MRIIYTFWPPKTGDLRLWKGGWHNPDYHYSSWVASVMQSLKFYSEVELYTDARGKAILVDNFRLPFSKVTVSHDKIQATTTMSSIGKIYTYSLQRSPYYHLDSDIYLFSPIPEYALLAEGYDSEGTNDSVYNNPLAELRQALDLPLILQGNVDNAFNFGIFGGTNVGELGLYSNTVMQVINDNEDFFRTETTEYISAIEQGWGYLMLKDKISLLLEDYSSEGFFTHLMDAKQGATYATVRKNMERWVARDWPAFYERIKD